MRIARESIPVPHVVSDCPRGNWRNTLLEIDGAPPSGYPSAVTLAEAGWSELENRLLLGFCHDLNGRVTSLYAVSQLVDLGEPLPGSFDAEVERLADVAKRVMLLRGDVEARPVPFSLTELLERASGLYAGLKDLTASQIEVNAGEGTPAILVNEARALRLMLLFFDLASHHGDGERVSLDVGGDPDGAVVSFPVRDGSMAALESLNRSAALEGGCVDHSNGRCTLRLPSLSRARAASR